MCSIWYSFLIVVFQCSNAHEIMPTTKRQTRTLHGDDDSSKCRACEAHENEQKIAIWTLNFNWLNGAHQWLKTGKFSHVKCSFCTSLIHFSRRRLEGFEIGVPIAISFENLKKNIRDCIVKFLPKFVRVWFLLLFTARWWVEIRNREKIIREELASMGSDKSVAINRFNYLTFSPLERCLFGRRYVPFSFFTSHFSPLPPTPDFANLTQQSRTFSRHERARRRNHKSVCSCGNEMNGTNFTKWWLKDLKDSRMFVNVFCVVDHTIWRRITSFNKSEELVYFVDCRAFFILDNELRTSKWTSLNLGSKDLLWYLQKIGTILYLNFPFPHSIFMNLFITFLQNSCSENFENVHHHRYTTANKCNIWKILCRMLKADENEIIMTATTITVTLWANEFSKTFSCMWEFVSLCSSFLKQ